MEYTFSVNVNDGELEVIEADSLEEAKKLFAELHPNDVGKVNLITSENGYEEF